MQFPSDSAEPLVAEPEYHRTVTVPEYFKRSGDMIVKGDSSGLVRRVRELVNELKDGDE
jgi:hypothetical protein